MLFDRDGTRALAIGSKNGSIFLLNPDTMTPLGGRVPPFGGDAGARQMLPYANDDRSQPLASVDNEISGENHSGMYGTAAVHAGLGHLFAGLGGWFRGGTDYTTTPFLRALDWHTLNDVWHTHVDARGVRRYAIPGSPLYQTPDEEGLSSPAVVNDVVFVSTTKPALYAFDAVSGLCLWSAAGLPTSGLTYCLGPAVSGDYVVNGCGDHIYIYVLRNWRIPWSRLIEERELPWPPIPPPDPGPIRELGELGELGE
jgi:outer membrane protein assembly factor BamB